MSIQTSGSIPRNVSGGTCGVDEAGRKVAVKQPSPKVQ